MSFVQSNAIVNIPNTVPTATTTVYSVSPADSGKIMLLTQNSTAAGTAVLQLNLPPVASSAGLRYKFVISGGTPITTNSILITTAAAAAVLRSVIIANSAAAATGGSIAARTTLTIVPITGGATGANVGDTWDCVCDGTYWYIAGNVSIISACTIA